MLPDRSLLYLNSFEKIDFAWDTTSLSSHLQLLQSLSQMCSEAMEATGKVCRAIN